MSKVNVRRVGESRSKYTLELRGHVLVFHMHNWIGHSTTYIPAERVTMERGGMRDGQLLIWGWGSILPVMFLNMMLLYPVFVLGEREMIGETLSAILLMIGMLPTLAAFGYAFVNTFRFIVWTTPTLKLIMETEQGPAEVEFYYPRKISPQIDELEVGVQALTLDEGSEILYPLHIAFTRQHVNPIRLTVARSLYGMFAVWLILHAAEFAFEFATGSVLTISPMILYVYLLPWIWFFGNYFLQRFWLHREPESFRNAVDHFYREDHGKAEAGLRSTIEQHPDHEPALRLLIEVLALRGDFDAAFARCGELARFQPDEAEALQGDLWALKRITARMEA